MLFPWPNDVDVTRCNIQQQGGWAPHFLCGVIMTWIIWQRNNMVKAHSFFEFLLWMSYQISPEWLPSGVTVLCNTSMHFCTMVQELQHKNAFCLPICYQPHHPPKLQDIEYPLLEVFGKFPLKWWYSVLGWNDRSIFCYWWQCNTGVWVETQVLPKALLEVWIIFLP